MARITFSYILVFYDRVILRDFLQPGILAGKLESFTQKNYSLFLTAVQKYKALCKVT